MEGLLVPNNDSSGGQRSQAPELTECDKIMILEFILLGLIMRIARIFSPLRKSAAKYSKSFYIAIRVCNGFILSAIIAHWTFSFLLWEIFDRVFWIKSLRICCQPSVSFFYPTFSSICQRIKRVELFIFN
jgi:hypothetical protein